MMKSGASHAITTFSEPVNEQESVPRGTVAASRVQGEVLCLTCDHDAFGASQ